MGFEGTGIDILKGQGFTKIRRPSHQPEYINYDFNAEKDGVKYAIEVKTTEVKLGGFSIPIGQLREMARQLTWKKRRGLLLFVDESRTPVEYYLFQMKRIGYGNMYDFDEEGRAIKTVRK